MLHRRSISISLLLLALSSSSSVKYDYDRHHHIVTHKVLVVDNLIPSHDGDVCAE